MKAKYVQKRVARRGEGKREKIIQLMTVSEGEGRVKVREKMQDGRKGQ